MCFVSWSSFLKICDRSVVILRPCTSLDRLGRFDSICMNRLHLELDFVAVVAFGVVVAIVVAAAVGVDASVGLAPPIIPEKKKCIVSG